MNYVWEVLLEAENSHVDRRELRFMPARNPGPYVEVSFADLNTVSLDTTQIEVNPLYRFSNIFSGLFAPDVLEYQDTRRIFLDVFMHYMAGADLLSGMHKQEFFYWFFTEEMQGGAFGEKAAEAFSLFDKKEQRVIITFVLGLYRMAHHKELFIHVVKKIYRNVIVYEGRDKAETNFLYIGKKETEDERKKIHFLVDTFLPFNENVEIFYDEHFGIIDVEETMVLDGILLI